MHLLQIFMRDCLSLQMRLVYRSIVALLVHIVGLLFFTNKTTMVMSQVLNNILIFVYTQLPIYRHYLYEMSACLLGGGLPNLNRQK